MNLSENNLKTYLKLSYTMPKKPTDYSRCVMYQIKCNDPEVDHVYVGHTTDFTKRKSKHKTDSKSSDRKLYRTIRENGGWDNFKMLQVETFPCNNKREAEAREDQLMTALKANMNQIRAFMTAEQICERKKQYREANKEQLAERRKQHYQANKECSKQHYEANKERIAEQQKQYREANKEHINEQQKQHYEANKERIAERKKQYREANKEQLAERRKQHYQANKEHINARTRAWYQAKKESIKQYREANKERINEQRKQYREANKERINARTRAWYQAKKEQSSLAAKQLLNEQTC